MSWMNAKASGWTAFDLKQKQRNGILPEIQKDPFPPVSHSNLASLDARTIPRKDHKLEKSFSSAVTTPLDFPNLTENKGFRNQASGGHRGSESSSSIAPENSSNSVFEKLKEMYIWADDSLITDVLLAASNDFVMASDFLGGMVPTDYSQDNRNSVNAWDLHSNTDSFSSDRRKINDTASAKTVTRSLGMAANSRDENSVKIDLQEGVGRTHTMQCDDISDLDAVIQRLRDIPMEPEWEEDDLYLSHRKDALKMMRSASNHSRAANNAFLRGDHASAKYHSKRAREDWSAAETLNAEAANKILSITNKNNDMWKLDLHGLHATEAIQVMQERLRKIESIVTVNRSVSPNRDRTKSGIIRSASQEPRCRFDMERLDPQMRPSRQLQNSLQVITGIGNHSRGEASLPVSVKRFFEDNGYRFDETRPGVITVRPKYNHS